VKTFLIEGRLNGGQRKAYALRFVQSRNDYFSRTSHSSPIAQRFQRYADRPVIFTRQGRLEVSTPALQGERPANVIIVDMRRWRAIARYYAPGEDDCFDLSPLAKPATKAIWDEGGERCVSIRPLGAQSGTSCPRLRTGKCTLPKELVPVGMPLERLFDVAREFRLLDFYPNDEAGTDFGGDGWGARSYRIPNTKLLVLEAYCYDCGD
jgi:hypothetical protein